MFLHFFFFKQKTAYEMRISDWSSDVCSSDLYYHGLCTLAYVATKTTKIALGTSVVVLPFRHPMELAKYAATLDQLYEGRVLLGVGVGGLIDEFEHMGITLEQHGAIRDENLSIVRKLCHTKTVTNHVTRWTFDDVMGAPTHTP